MIPLQRYFSSFSSSSSTLTSGGTRRTTTARKNNNNIGIEEDNDNDIVAATTSTTATTTSERHNNNSNHHAHHDSYFDLIDVNVDDGSVVLFIDAYSPAEFHQLLTVLSCSYDDSFSSNRSSSSSTTTSGKEEAEQEKTTEYSVLPVVVGDEDSILVKTPQREVEVEESSSSSSIRSNNNNNKNKKMIRQLQIHRTCWNLQRTKSDMKLLFETLRSSSWLEQSLYRIELSGFAGTTTATTTTTARCNVGGEESSIHQEEQNEEQNDHELDGLSTFLDRHSQLERFELRLRSGIIPESILKALSTVPRLEEIHLVICGSIPLGKLFPTSSTSSSSSVSSLTIGSGGGKTTSPRSPLKHLYVYDNGRIIEPFQFRQDHGLDLIQQLRGNQTNLETLFLLPGIDDVTAKAMVEYVIPENNTLQSIHVSLCHACEPILLQPPRQQQQQHHQQRAQQQRHQDNDSSFSNQSIADEFCALTAKSLLANTTLRTFSVHDMNGSFSSEVTSIGKEALLTMLAYNFTLSHFCLYDDDAIRVLPPSPHGNFLVELEESPPPSSGDNNNNNNDTDNETTKIDSSRNVIKEGHDDDNNFQLQQDFFLRLNSLSRGKLLMRDNVPREEWIDKLVEQKEDLDCLYYFLKSCPSLCDDFKKES